MEHERLKCWRLCQATNKQRDQITLGEVVGSILLPIGEVHVLSRFRELRTILIDVVVAAGQCCLYQPEESRVSLVDASWLEWRVY